jgi:hypothetical protein
VELVVGAAVAGELAQFLGKGYPSLELMDNFAESGFSLVLIAIIRNDGRQAVTVGMCEWRANTVGTAGTLAGDPFPRQLEAGASCKVAFDLLALLLMLRQSGAVSKERKRGISAVVHLGTGGRVRSKPLKIPLEARQASRLRTIR